VYKGIFILVLGSNDPGPVEGL